MPIVGCTVCKYVLTLLFFERRRSIDPQDYPWTLTTKRSSLFKSCPSVVDGEETFDGQHILMQFSMGSRQKGQKTIYFQLTASWLIVEHIKNRFCTVNWTQIYLILNESQNIFVPCTRLEWIFCCRLAFVSLSNSHAFAIAFHTQLIHHHSTSFSFSSGSFKIQNRRKFWGWWCNDKLTAGFCPWLYSAFCLPHSAKLQSLTKTILNIESADWWARWETHVNRTTGFELDKLVGSMTSKQTFLYIFIISPQLFSQQLKIAYWSLGTRAKNFFSFLCKSFPEKKKNISFTIIVSCNRHSRVKREPHRRKKENKN